MEKFTETDRHFISLLQDTINRMANNSANCKNWLLGIVTAVFALVVSNVEFANLLLLLLVLIGFFYFLDSYYLRLENNFRKLEENFVKKTLEKNDDTELKEWLYNFDFTKLECGNVDRKNKYKAFKSKATWPFYLVMLIAICAIYCIIAETNPFISFFNWICSLNDSSCCCKCK